MTDTAKTDQIQITLNGSTVHANPGELIIDACERNGVHIPRFCYHPRMTPVGMCRMCLVEVDSGRGPALTPSCMIECTPDMVVDTESAVTKKAQDGVLEFLLINHPLDCPVCDKGGECPLQDNTMSYGPGESRFVEQKRHFEKPIPISDTVYLDRERCILCDRCTRFAKEVAGDPLIHFLDRGNQTQVNTFPDDPFSSYFSGNTVQICPVGALTAKPYRFRARPWDLEEVESTATFDSVGGRITVQSSRNKVLRYLGVDADAVNWGWLSDRERFGFEAFNSEDRLRDPLVRGDGLGTPAVDGKELVATSWAEAMGQAAASLEGVDPSRVGIIGGARLTNEAQYAWAKLAKGIIGTDNVDAQMGDGLPAHHMLGLPRATIDEACTPGGTVILLGPDPKETLGSLYLRLRHAIIEDGVTLIELTPRRTGLSHLTPHTLHPRPGEVSALARALVAGDTNLEVSGVGRDAINAAHAAIGDGPVTVVLGRPSLAESAGPALDAAYTLAHLDGVKFLSALRRGNVHGAIDMGLAPGLLPGRSTLESGRTSFEGAWDTVPVKAGLDTPGILAAAAAGTIDVLVLLGADPIGDVPDRNLARLGLEGAGTVIAVDLFLTESTSYADVVLAASGPGEVDGTFTNLEGRLSLLAQKVTAPGTARADWIIAAELAQRMGADLGVTSLDDIWAELSTVSGAHAGLDLETIAAHQREGIVIRGSLDIDPPEPTDIPGRNAYGHRLVVTRVQYDDGVMLSHCPSSAHLAPGTTLTMHPADFDTMGVDPGAAVSLTSTAGDLTTTAYPDAVVPRGSVALAFNQPDARASDLLDITADVTDVRVARA